MTTVQTSIRLDPGLTLELGEHSYIHDQTIRNPSGALTHIRIGKFCSIATDLTLIGYDHHSEWMTTYPFLDDWHRANWPGTNGLPYPQAPEFGSNKNRGDIVIGNDVWIGYGVKLFKGITIGDGAVVGACALVNKSVEPYTVVAGIPARPLRKRFAEPEIAFLQKIRWWDWPPALINRHMRWLCSSQFAELEQALAGDPDYERLENQARAEAWLTKADSAYTRNDLPAACAALEQCLAWEPEAVPTLVCLGNIQFQLGAFAEARQTFARAAGLRPGDADIQVRLANAAFSCQQTEVADRAVARAMELDAANPDALRLSIHRHLELGRYAQGAEQCWRLLEANPNDLLLLLQLGKCLREINDPASARWCYERALEVDPNCTLAGEILARLNGQPAQSAAGPTSSVPCSVTKS